MLAAFETGGLLRAIQLLVVYSFISLVGEEIGLKIMVMICFLGIKQDNFRVGTAFLPKLFLENVDLETFEETEKRKGAFFLMVQGFVTWTVENIGCRETMLDNENIFII